MFKSSQESKYLTEGATREIVRVVLREAIQEQARELEKHLTDIDKRLRELEKRR